VPESLPTPDDVLAALRGVIDPELGSDIVDLGMARSADVLADGSVDVTVALTTAGCPLRSQLQHDVVARIGSLRGVTDVRLHWAEMTADQRASAMAKARWNVTQRPENTSVPLGAKVILVASGKGGVGKSTTAVNLALGLAALGLKVGLLDADIYGPSMPRLLGIRGRPQTRDGKILQPMENYGLKVMSIGFLVEEETPMIWRGPMVISALTQMLREVEWGPLDVLVVDMPPGTGDAQLTMAQQVPLAGAVIVSTPQDLALIDARKGLNMFRKVDVPLLGIVENMSYFVAPDTGKRYDIFGHGGAKREAERLGVPFLGEVPLVMDIRESSDGGRPVVAADPQGAEAAIYREIATRVRDRLAQEKATAENAVPSIVFE
jgi:ATP-binding protein involved in chromosome partitioning